MRGLIDKPPTETSTAPSPERRRSRLAAWLAARGSRLVGRWSLVVGRRSALRDPRSAISDPIPPEVQDVVRAAFRQPKATDALCERVAAVCRPPETALCGDRQGPPSRPRTRNGLQPGGWGHVRPRWDWIGVAVLVVAAIGLSMRREHDVLAATIRAMEVVRVVHVVSQGHLPGGKAIELETWIMPEVGMFHSQKTEGTLVNILVDDLKHVYRYDVPARRVTIKPSSLQNPAERRRRAEAFTHVGVLKAVQATRETNPTKIDWVTRDGRRLRRVHRVHPLSNGWRDILIDPQTHRIVLTEERERQPNGWEAHLVSRLDYPDLQTVDLRRFRFQIPAGVTAVPEAEEPRKGDPAYCVQMMVRVGEALRLTASRSPGNEWPKALRPALDRFGGDLLLHCPLDKKATSSAASFVYHQPSPDLAERTRQALLVLRNRMVGAPEADVRVSDPVLARTILLEDRHHPGVVLRLYADGHTATEAAR